MYVQTAAMSSQAALRCSPRPRAMTPNAPAPARETRIQTRIERGRGIRMGDAGLLEAGAGIGDTGPGWRRLQNMDYGPQSVNADSGRVRTLGLWRIRAADIVLAALLNVQPTGPPVMTRTRRVLTISLCLTTFAIGC